MVRSEKNLAQTTPVIGSNFTIYIVAEFFFRNGAIRSNFNNETNFDQNRFFKTNLSLLGPRSAAEESFDSMIKWNMNNNHPGR